MKASTMSVGLALLGFTPADQSLISDRPIVNLVYLTRVYQTQHQYLALICAHDDGRFLEATLEVYPKPRSRHRQDNLAPLILRSFEAILAAVNRTYGVSTPPKRA